MLTVPPTPGGLSFALMLARSNPSSSATRTQFSSLTSELQARYGSQARELEPNHWMFEVPTADQRSQVVHLLLKQRAAQGRDVSRIVADSPIGPVPQRYDFERLLRLNADLDVGAICIADFRNEENETISYFTLRATHLVQTADFEEIWEMVEKVAGVADALEKDIYASDLH